MLLGKLLPLLRRHRPPVLHQKEQNFRESSSLQWLRIDIGACADKALHCKGDAMRQLLSMPNSNVTHNS